MTNTKVNAIFTVLVACLLLNQAICVKAYNLSNDNLIRNKKNYYSMAIRSLAEDRSLQQSDVISAGFSTPTNSKIKALNQLKGKKANKKYHAAHHYGYGHGGENGEECNGEYAPTQDCGECDIPAATHYEFEGGECGATNVCTWIPTECNIETIVETCAIPEPTCETAPVVDCEPIATETVVIEDCETAPVVGCEPIATETDVNIYDDCTEENNKYLPKSWSYRNHRYNHHAAKSQNDQGFLGGW